MMGPLNNCYARTHHCAFSSYRRYPSNPEKTDASAVTEVLVVVGEDFDGTVWTSIGAETTWARKTISSMEKLEAVVCDRSSGHFVAVARYGKAYYSADSGATSSVGATGVSSDLRAVASNGTGVIVAVGNSGRILRSVDGGATWASGALESGVVLFSVAAR